MADKIENKAGKCVTAALTDFVYNSRYEDLPAEAVHETKRILLDTIGVAIAGNTVEKGKLAVKLAKRNGGDNEATVIGGGKVAAANAAFANGELMNALDWDITCPAGHLTPCVMPAPMAMGEVADAKGKDLVLATALSHEVAIRISRSLGNQRSIVESKGKAKQVLNPRYGFGFSTIAGAAASAKIMGLERDKINDAIGLAAGLAPVPSMAKWYRTAPPSTMSKYTSAGWVAQASATAALLAESGYRGDRTALDGQWGFWRMFALGNKWKYEAILNGLGTDWAFTDEINHKVYPCCGVMQIGLDLLGQIKRENNLKPEEIEKVKIFADPLTKQPIWTSKTVETNVDAQFSIPYVYAAQLMGIEPVKWQLPETYRRADVVAAMDKIESKENPDYFKVFLSTPNAKERPMGSGSPTVVKVYARGQVFSKEGNFAKGRSLPKEFRFTDEEVVEKFLVTAGTRFSDNRVREIIDMVERIEELGSMRELMNAVAE